LLPFPALFQTKNRENRKGRGISPCLFFLLTLIYTDRLECRLETAGLYCQGCGQCVKQCIARLPIPELMSTYMYAYGYRNPRFAQEVIISLDLPSQVCEDYSSCPVKCPNGWNLAGKIRNIARIRDVPSEFLV
jgi:ferredoxin